MTSPLPLAVDESLQPPRQPGRVRTRYGRVRRSPFMTPYWGLLALLVLLAIFAPLITPYGPVHVDLDQQLLPPSREHLFGTDTNGMDIYSRTIWATRTDLSVALAGVAIGMAIGVLLGATSGYLGGIGGESLSRVAEVIQSIPLFLFALMVFAALGNSRVVLVGIVAVVNIPIFLKLTRAVVLPMVTRDFIAAARCAGLRPRQIISRHVLPNALGPVASQFSLSCAYAIQIIAAVAFLGLGVPIPEPEWGSMIQDGAGKILDGQWWISVFPGLAILAAVVALGGIGRQLARWYAN
jgi:peptide/nickel transport system permease protein